MLMHRKGSLTATLLAVALTVACSGGSSNSPPDKPPAQAGWTILVYVAADNDLEPFALGDLQEMTLGASSGVNIIAQVDRASGYSSAAVANLPNWTSAKRLKVNSGSITELADLGETDTTSPTTLANFIGWGVKAYPASHYMLVMWDHGGGWTGFGVDELLSVGAATGHDVMNLGEITNGISVGLSAAGLAKFDIIGFDACVMATLEVGNSLAPYASYLLASEETEPGHGWDYSVLNGVSSLGAVAVGTRIADGFKAQADSPAWDTGASITLSLIDLSRIAAVQSAVTALKNAYGAVPTMTPVAGALGRERARAVSFGKNPNPAGDMHLVDIGDLFGAVPELGTTGTALKTAATAAVVYQVRGAAFAQATGLSIYFPRNSAYYNSTRYTSIPGMDDWRTVLSAYYGVTAAPAFDLANPNTGIAGDATIFSIVGALTVGSLASVANAYFVYGLPGGSGDAWAYGDAPPDVVTDTGVDYLVGTWDYTFLRLSQSTPGAHAEYGYLSLSVDGTNAIASIPLAYYAPGSSQATLAVRLITVDLNSSSVTSDVYFGVTATGAVGQLSPPSGSAMRAVVKHFPVATQWSSEWTESTSSGAFDATQPIAIDFITLGAGNPFFAGLRVENAAGNGDWISTSVSNPPTKP